MDLALQPLPLEMKTVEVEAERLDPIQDQTRMGVVDVPVSQIENAPVLMGEVDLMKTLQLLPGVQSGAEGMSGLYVRGGGPDQNLILLDDAPVYNASHLFGFFSVFNTSCSQERTTYKGRISCAVRRAPFLRSGGCHEGRQHADRSKPKAPSVLWLPR